MGFALDIDKDGARRRSGPCFALDIDKETKIRVAKEDPRNSTHQTLLYSATVPSWVKQVSRKSLKPEHKHVDLICNDTNIAAAAAAAAAGPCL
jgi:superfamily II DNA/RNA helicase